MEKRELVALLSVSFWCLVMVEWLFLAVPCGCLQFLIVVFPDHTHYFFIEISGITGYLHLNVSGICWPKCNAKLTNTKG